MFGKYGNIKIRGIASAVPEQVIDNIDCAEKLGNRRAKNRYYSQESVIGIV